MPTGNPIQLAAIQRLNTSVGYVSAWTGRGLALAYTEDGGSTWQKIAVPASPVSALRFVDSNVGWAAGLIPRPMAGIACQQAPPTPMDPCYGVILRTQDGGTTWQKSLLIPYYGTYGYPVQQIQAIDAQIAWALTLACTSTSTPLGPQGRCPTEIYHTTDGGKTWTRLAAGYIVAIRFATPSRGWRAVANLDGTFDIGVTSDGGTTWTTHLRTTSGWVVGLDAANELTAWVMTQDSGSCSMTICVNYELLETTDGGLTWSSLGNPKTSAAGSCSGGFLVGPLFASPTRGWLAENIGAGGARESTGLLQTDDGGKTWRCQSHPTNSYAVSAADPLHVWVLVQPLTDDSSAIFSSDDGGASWRELNLAGLAN